MAVIVFGDTLHLINSREVPRRVVRRVQAPCDHIGRFLVESWILMLIGAQIII
jgi:hypothetical protein